MSSNGYHRCEYSLEGKDCDVWFKSDEGPMCILHRGSVGPENGLASEDFKSEYIRLRNEAIVECSKMSFDELDAHIAGIEKVIENERTKLLSARGVRSNKLQDLSDDERKERQKIRYVGPDGGQKVKRESKMEKLKVTMKSDPVGYFMNSLGFTRENAEAMARQAGLIK